MTRRGIIGPLLLVGACGGAGVAPAAAERRGRPDWIDHPGEGVSASAGFHVHGRHAQEELAIERARSEYAKRFGVVVTSVRDSAQVVTGEHGVSIASEEVHQEVHDKTVNAVVRAKWLDADADVLWVWLAASSE